MTEAINKARRRPALPTYESSLTSSSSSILVSDAPTPNNTYFNPDDCASISRKDPREDACINEEMMYDGGLGLGGDISLRPSLTPSSSTHPGLNSRVPSSFSSHASSYLLPTPTPSSIETSFIPHSTRPVPAPPLSLRSDTTPSLSTPPSSVLAGVKFGDTVSDLEATTSRGSRGTGAKQDDVDEQRLQQLGYDAVLGRDYTFWSSLSISWLNIGCLQVHLALLIGDMRVADS